MLRTVVAAAITVGLLTACTPTTAHHGVAGRAVAAGG